MQKPLNQQDNTPSQHADGKFNSGLKVHLLEVAVSQNNANIGVGVKCTENNSMMLAGKQVAVGGIVMNPPVLDSAAQMHQETFNVTPKNIGIGNLEAQNTGKKQEIAKQDEDEDEEELKIPILFNNFEGFKDVDMKKQASAKAISA